VQTPGAQPPTIHATRSFAILHAAIYDSWCPSPRRTGLISSRFRQLKELRVDAAAAQAGPRHTGSALPQVRAELDSQLARSS